MVAHPAAVLLSWAQDVLEAAMAILTTSVTGSSPPRVQALHVLEEDVQWWEELLQLLASNLAWYEETLAAQEQHIGMELGSLAVREKGLEDWVARLQEGQALLQQ